MFAVTMETLGDRLMMWRKTDRFDELVNKMVEALSNRESDPLLIQHLGDCVRRQDKIEATLKHQDDLSMKMHNENSARLKAIEDSSRMLLICIVGALLALAGTLVMQIVNNNSHKVEPQAMMHNHGMPK